MNHQLSALEARYLAEQANKTTDVSSRVISSIKRAADLGKNRQPSTPSWKPTKRP